MSWFRKFVHETMGWHLRTEVINFDGASAHGRCKTCGYEGMFDSQGNLF